MKDLARSLALRAARQLTAGRGRVVMYHRFGSAGSFRRLDAQVFEEQVRYLERNYRMVSLQELVERLASGRRTTAGLCALTVDDGYRDFLEFAYPVLRRHGVPATLFVVSDFLDGRLWLWFDAVHHLLHATRRRVLRWAGGGAAELPLRDEGERNRAWSLIADGMLEMTPAERATALHTLCVALDVELPERPDEAYAPMSWSEARGMDPALVEIGAHTLTHPILSRCSQDELEREIGDCRAVVEEKIGRAVTSFCYPNGGPRDFDERCVETARRSGYRCAVTAYGGLVGPRADLFRLQRVPASEHEVYFRGQVDGLEAVKHGISRWLRPAAS